MVNSSCFYCWFICFNNYLEVSYSAKLDVILVTNILLLKLYSHTQSSKGVLCVCVRCAPNLNPERAIIR